MVATNKIDPSNINDLITIATPIDSNQVGENILLSYYDLIKKSRPYKDIYNPNSSWQQVLSLCVEALKISKDFNVCCWTLEALSFQYHLRGMKVGLNIIVDLLQYFPNCYPTCEEERTVSLEWINNHISTWIDEEEILPGLYFKDVYKDILYAQLNKDIYKDLWKRTTCDSEFLQDRIDTLNSIINNLNNLSSITFRDSISFFQKVYGFYIGYRQYLVDLHKTSPSDNENLVMEKLMTKDDIYNLLLEKVEEGLKFDKNDLLLFMIKKILLLRNKSNEEVYKLIRNNSIEGLII